MAADETPVRPARLTARGAATKTRILRAAADLMYARGVAATTLEDVRVASGTSKSQLYRYYPDKDLLVHDVIALQADQVLERQRHQLQRLHSLRGLERWRDTIVEGSALRGGPYRCPLGTLASEVADRNEDQRSALADHFATWRSLLAAGLTRMRTSGALSPEADPDALATGLIAALQGGYLLAQVARDVTPMKTALDMAIDSVRRYASPS